jgi:hypothetical protein
MASKNIFFGGNFSESAPVSINARTVDAPRDIPAGEHAPKCSSCTLESPGGPTMRPARLIFAFALIISSPLPSVADDGRSSQREAVALSFQAASPDTAATSARSDTKPFRGFFGYLEFDVDPDAPGGVPGFGAISDPTRTTAEARSD